MSLDFNKLREILAGKIDNDASTVNEAHAYSKKVADLDSWPAVYIVPGNNEAEYASTSQDKHTYNLTVIGFYKQGQETFEEAEKAVGDTISELVNMLTKDDWIDRDYFESAEPVTSEYQAFDEDDGTYFGFSIEVRMVVRIDT